MPRRLSLPYSCIEMYNMIYFYATICEWTSLLQQLGNSLACARLRLVPRRLIDEPLPHLRLLLHRSRRLFHRHFDLLEVVDLLEELID